jgi:cytochrome c5
VSSEKKRLMSKRMLVTFMIVSLAVLSASLFAACGGPASPQEEEPTVAPTPTPQEEEPTKQPTSTEGVSLLQERCTTCHGLSRVTREQKTREKWEQTVTRMVGKGAQLNAGEQATLIEYLAETYGP